MEETLTPRNSKHTDTENGNGEDVRYTAHEGADPNSFSVRVESSGEKKKKVRRGDFWIIHTEGGIIVKPVTERAATD